MGEISEFIERDRECENGGVGFEERILEESRVIVDYLSLF
jgi:hypothetical protein